MLKRVILSVTLSASLAFSFNNFSKLRVDYSLNKVNINEKDPFVKKEILALKYLLYIDDLIGPFQFKTILPINNLYDFRLLKFKKVIPLLLSSAYRKEIKIDTLKKGLDVKNLKNFEEFKIESLEGIPEMINIVKDMAKIVLLSQIEWNKKDKEVNQQIAMVKVLYELFENRINYEYNTLLRALNNPDYAKKILHNSGILDKNGNLKRKEFLYSSLPYLTAGKYKKFNDYVYFRRFQDEFVYTYFPGNFDSGKNIIRKYFYLMLKHPDEINNFKKEYKFNSFILNDFYSKKYRWGFKSLPKFFIVNLFKIKFIKPKYREYLVSKLSAVVSDYQYNAIKKFYIDLKKDVRVTRKRPNLNEPVLKTIAKNASKLLMYVKYNDSTNYRKSFKTVYYDINKLLNK